MAGFPRFFGKGSALFPARSRVNPIRVLYWGLVFFSVLMFFAAWAGVGELIIPPTSGPGIRLVDMPAPLIAFNAVICALPPAAFLLILLGVGGMMRTIPKVGPKLVWRVGDHYVTAVMVAGLFVVAYVALFVGILVLAVLQVIGIPIDPAVPLAGGVVFGTMPIALGWYLMLISGWSLSAVADQRERMALWAAVTWSGALALFLIGAQVIASILMGATAMEPNAAIPPRVPWADAAAGVAGFAALVVLVLVARRACLRFDKAAPVSATLAA